MLALSAYFGVRGPTANRLFGVGRIVRPLLPHDLRNSITEVSNQPRQLPAVREALSRLTIPITVVHGDEDSFIPLPAAQKLATDLGATFVLAPGGDHFLNACCVGTLVTTFNETIARAEAQETLVSSAAH